MAYELIPESTGVRATEFWRTDRISRTVDGIPTYTPSLVNIQSIIEDSVTHEFGIDTADMLPIVNDRDPLHGTVPVIRVGISQPYELGFIADLRAINNLAKRRLAFGECDEEAQRRNEQLKTQQLIGAILREKYTEMLHFVTRNEVEFALFEPQAQMLLAFSDELSERSKVVSAVTRPPQLSPQPRRLL